MDTEGTELKYYPPASLTAMKMMTARELMLFRQLRATENALLDVDKRAQEMNERYMNTIKELRVMVDDLRAKNEKLTKKIASETKKTKKEAEKAHGLEEAA